MVNICIYEQNNCNILHIQNFPSINLAAIEERTKDSCCQNRELRFSYEPYQFRRLIEVNSTGFIVAHGV